MSDAAAAYFKDLPRLEHLLLTDSYISDGGLFSISQLQNLRTLDLDGSDLIGDGGLELVAGMKQLQTLRVRSRSISDSGLEYLAPMKQLRTLAVEDSLAVSDEGLEFVGRLTDLEDLSLAQAFQVTDAGPGALGRADEAAAAGPPPAGHQWHRPGPSAGHDRTGVAGPGRHAGQRRGLGAPEGVAQPDDA